LCEVEVLEFLVPAQLQADLESLPLFDWLTIEVTPLTPHPVMEGKGVPD
jgi:muconolactone delta-isomerase